MVKKKPSVGAEGFFFECFVMGYRVKWSPLLMNNYNYKQHNVLYQILDKSRSVFFCLVDVFR